MQKQWLKRIGSLMLSLGILVSCALPARAKESDDKSLCTPEEEQQIWDFLMDLTGNELGAAGVMGNLFYESHLDTKNLESNGKTIPKFKEGDYTSNVDNRTYRRFTTDGLGYGIAQWTNSKRKRQLLQAARAKKTSVGDLSVQLYVLGEEIKDYGMLHRLSTSEDLEFVTEYFLMNYENPRDQSDAEKEQRLKKSQEFLNKYFVLKKQDRLTDAQKKVVDIAAFSDVYGITAEKGRSLAWANAVLKAAGQKTDQSKTALDSMNMYGLSTDFSKIPVGAAVYGKTKGKGVQVGIYVGDDQIYHNLDGIIQVDRISDFKNTYTDCKWGWLAGSYLNKEK